MPKAAKAVKAAPAVTAEKVAKATRSAKAPRARKPSAKALKASAGVSTARARKSSVLDPVLAERLCAELDALRDEVMKDIGERDARHIRRVLNTSRWSAIAGRSLLMFGIDPFTWVGGTALLGLAKILNNMEIGHNVLHGQYDWMNDPSLDSRTFEWDIVCASSSWKHSHNVIHHNHTNIVGLDKDFGYANFRIDDLQEWKSRHRYQLLTKAISPFVFEWGVGVQDAEPIELREGRITREEFARRLGPFKWKAKKQVIKDYVLFPALALWNAPRVLAGNVVANVIRNMWTCYVIFCGHFTTSVHAYTIEETRNETRGQWYARQVRGSANISGGRVMFLLTGHLSHQIEHHLFPDMPAHRYPEIAPRVKEICARYGLEYSEASLWSQYMSVLKRLQIHSHRPEEDLSGAVPA